MCGIFGFINYSGDNLKDLSKLTNFLAQESAIRGTDATGIAFNNPGGIKIVKDDKSAYKMKFVHPDNVKSVIGHTRHSTKGSEKQNYNNHPFIGSCINSKFALVHNGVLSNDAELRKKHKFPKTKIETDSYIAVQLIQSKNFLDFDSIRYMAEQVNGSFSFAILDKKANVYLVKGDSPLSILHFPKLKIYVYASTAEILFRGIVDYPPIFSELKNGGFEVIDISEGEILKIRPDGVIDKTTFDYNTYYGKDWWYYGSYSWFDSENDKSSYTKNDYIEDLKSVASYQGLDPDYIDVLISEGFALEEVEDYLYCCTGGEI